MAIRGLLIEGFSLGLRYTKNDVRQVERAFHSIEISTVKSSGNASQIEMALKEVCVEAFNNDTLIIYYSGHGELVKGKLNLVVDNTQNVFEDSLVFISIANLVERSKYGQIVFILVS